MPLESELRDTIAEAALACEASGDDHIAWDEANKRLWVAARHLRLVRHLAARAGAWKKLARAYRARLRNVILPSAPRPLGVRGRPKIVYEHASVRDALRGRTMRGAARYLNVPQSTLIKYVCEHEAEIFSGIKIEWDAQPLGKMSDTAIARCLGVTQQMVAREREARAISRRQH